MGTMMYRQKPNIPALIAAGICFVGGLLLLGALQHSSGVGQTSSSPLLLTTCLTFVLTVVFLLIAFSRYRYTHLWKSGVASHSDRYKDQHRKHHHRHHHHHHHPHR